MLIGDVTNQAKKRTGLVFPATPYAGAAPSSTVPPLTTPTAAPGTVADSLRNTTNTVDQAKVALNANQPMLDNYLKPNAAGTTPFRQALTNTKASDTANAYDNAVSQIRNKSTAMGFSDRSQPVTFGAESGLANERAKAIADIPNKVNLEAQPVEFQAAQLQQGNAGILNSLANTQQGGANTLEAQQAAKDAQKATLAGNLANTAIGVGTPLIQQALANTSVSAPTMSATIPPSFEAAAGPVPGDPNFVGPTQPRVTNLPGSTGTIAGLGTAGIGAALASTAAPAALTPAVTVGLDFAGTGLGGAAASTAGGAVAGGASAGADATAAGASTAASGGLGPTLAALATNPVTWAIAGAIGTAILWAKSQAHHEATTFVRDFQDVFANDKGTGHLNKVVDEFDRAYAAGTLDKASAQAARDETARLIEEFKQQTNKFSQQGSDENRVAHQSAATMAQLFGPNWEGIVGKMDSEIARLG